MSFPTGFSAEFEVLVNNISLGFFNTDQSVNFTELLGHGVSSFAIRNITPGVDPASLTAFPIQLAFNNATASFTMTPVISGTTVPEPSTLMLLGAGAMVFGLSRQRRGKKG